MIVRYFLFCLLLCISCLGVHAEEVTYRIKQYNADAQAYVLQAWGRQPEGSVATFFNDYGATAGNRYNQIPRNREAQLLLEGWAGCTLRSVTLWLCSNNKAGTLGLSLQDGETVLYKQSPEDFASDTWFGEWVSKDLGVYVSVTKDVEAAIKTDEVVLTLKGGTREGSVYVDAITLDYDAAECPTESPMGWVYEKLEAKSTVAEGDVVMLYRSGDAAGDIDGMETSHYLDAIGVTSTTCVMEYDVERFTLSHDETGSHWIFTDQWGRRLGAQKAQQLAWDDGVLTWDIELGYSGATIASTNTKYGTLRYNAPSGSYPRFWNYTSKTLPLPYLYRRVRQQEPVQSTAVLLPTSERTVVLGEQDTLVVKAMLQPESTTDRRIGWGSDDPTVATVRNGIVHPVGVGTCTLTASSYDGGGVATLVLHVVEPETDGGVSLRQESTPSLRYTLDGRPAGAHHRGIVISGGRKYPTTIPQK